MTIRWCEVHEASQPTNDGPEAFNRCYEWWICEVQDELFEGGACSFVEIQIATPPAQTPEDS